MPGYDLVVKGENKGPKVWEGQGNPIGRLAEYAVGTQFIDLPREVVHYRFNRRFWNRQAFHRLLTACVSTTTVTRNELLAHI